MLLSSRSKDQIGLLEYICDDVEAAIRARRRAELAAEAAARDSRPVFYARARVRNDGKFARCGISAQTWFFLLLPAAVACCCCLLLLLQLLLLLLQLLLLLL